MKHDGSNLGIKLSEAIRDVDCKTCRVQCLRVVNTTYLKYKSKVEIVWLEDLARPWIQLVVVMLNDYCIDYKELFKDPLLLDHIVLRQDKYFACLQF